MEEERSNLRRTPLLLPSCQGGIYYLHDCLTVCTQQQSSTPHALLATQIMLSAPGEAFSRDRRFLWSMNSLYLCMCLTRFMSVAGTFSCRGWPTLPSAAG